MSTNLQRWRMPLTPEDLGPPWQSHPACKITPPKPPFPSLDQIADKEFIVHVTRPADDLGRYQFMAFWRDAAVPGYVRGQVFWTDLEGWVAGNRAEGWTVTIRNPGGGEWMSDTATRLADLLAGVAHPTQPRDEDGRVLAPKITRRLKSAGTAARTVDVYGWVDYDNRVMLFLHLATLADDHIVDFTARQFHRRKAVPARWIAPKDDYCERFAAATGVQRVTLVDRGRRGRPRRSSGPLPLDEVRED